MHSIARSLAAFSTGRRSVLPLMGSRSRPRYAGAPFRSPCRGIPRRCLGLPMRPRAGGHPRLDRNGRSDCRLRVIGAWTNISDRIALFADYARSAEHSAQQDSGRLRRYEREFKAGKINILNCSTTMEMGVDIGSVSSVMMTNVPPSIANYRQRVGRAGRRGQAVALAFTFCKDRPLDSEAFRDPRAYLQRTLAAPKVTLSSRPIVQRHVNAFLLGSFMRERAGDALKMQIGAFLGCPADPKEARPPKVERPVEGFIDWLERPATAGAIRDSLAMLTRRSILEGDQSLVEDAKDAIAELANDFVAEWEGLVALAKDEGLQDAGKSRMAVELRRMCGEFLLGSLADRGIPSGSWLSDRCGFVHARKGIQVSARCTAGRRAPIPDRRAAAVARSRDPRLCAGIGSRSRRPRL